MPSSMPPLFPPVALTLAVGAALTGHAVAATGDPVLINEVLASHTGADDTEFVELFGTPGQALDGLSLIVVEGAASNAGEIDQRLDFGADDALGETGFFLVGNPAGLGANYGVTPDVEIPNDYLENSSFTLALVETVSLGEDVVSGAETVLDTVALTGGDDAETAVAFFFDAPVVDVEQDFLPAGVRRLADGIDTDTLDDWAVSDFRLGPDNTPRASGGTIEPPAPAEPVSIMAIQGAAQRSPLEGRRVATTGVVTAVDSNAFYLQDPGGDGDEATSDAILVFTGSAPTVAVGDLIEIVAEVAEFVPGGESSGNLSTTQLASIESLAVLSSGSPLPEPVRIGGRHGRNPPTRTIDDDGLTRYEPRRDGIDFFESLEAMRVTVVRPRAVAGINRFGELFTVAGNGRRPHATGLSRRGTLNISPRDYNPERVQLQFDGGILPDVEAPEIDTGARLENATGVVGYGFGNFEVNLTEPLELRRPSRLEPEVTRLGRPERALTVAAYNVLNLDPKVEEGVSSRDVDDDVGNGRFAAIGRHVAVNLGAPDIVALQEVQDDDGAERSDVTSAETTLATLVDAIEAAGGPRYEAIDNPFVGNGTSGGQPGGNIRVAFLYDPARVSLVDGSVEPIVDPVAQQNDPDNAFADTRPPLAATFAFGHEEITVVSVHFSSKGGSAPLFGTVQPATRLQEDPDVNGGVDERRAQASAVLDYVDGKRAENRRANIVVLGDFNEFEFLSPLQILETRLRNLTETLPRDERYSFVFQGNSQSLDHALVSRRLAHRARFDVVHVNSEFAGSPERASDHDPLLVQLRF